jgi:ketosteroid isomerase-like protein
MSQENVDRVGRGYALLKHAAETGDFEPWLDTVRPDVEWVPLDVFPDAEVVRGRDGVRARFKLLWEDFEQIAFEPEEIIDAGDDVVVQQHITARGKASRVDVDSRVYQVVRYRDDMLAQLSWYATRAEALKAVGLEE